MVIEVTRSKLTRRASLGVVMGILLTSPPDAGAKFPPISVPNPLDVATDLAKKGGGALKTIYEEGTPPALQKAVNFVGDQGSSLGGKFYDKVLSKIPGKAVSAAGDGLEILKEGGELVYKEFTPPIVQKGIGIMGRALFGKKESAGGAGDPEPQNGGGGSGADATPTPTPEPAGGPGGGSVGGGGGGGNVGGGGGGGAAPGSNYRIQAGDTLGDIAVVLKSKMANPPPPPPVWGPGGLVDTLARSNSDTISNPNLIYTGNMLRIPTDDELRRTGG